MRLASPLPAIVAIAAATLAGCLSGDGAEDARLADEDAGLLDTGTVRLEASDCRQGGGNSVYAMTEGETMVGPFHAADQRPEVGDPMIGAYGSPVMGPQNGIWHVATLCESYTFNGEQRGPFGMGWIAQMIERPEFDTWGEPRVQFMVADLSFTDTAFVDALKEAALDAEISPASETSIEWLVPGSYMRVIISEANHGTFDFSAELHKQFAEKQDEHIRFWMLPRTDGAAHDHGTAGVPGLQAVGPAAGACGEEVCYRPVAIDIHDTLRTGPTPRLAGESVGTFVHLNGDERHFGNPLGHYQDGFDRVIEIGPVPDGIEFDTTWLH